MGYESCANDEYRSQVGATNRPENIVSHYVSFVSSICIYLLVFESESVNVFSFHLFTDFSQVYFSAFAQIFPRSQRESNTSNIIFIFFILDSRQLFSELLPRIFEALVNSPKIVFQQTICFSVSI
jgi:hypothetical protein